MAFREELIGFLGAMPEGYSRGQRGALLEAERRGREQENEGRQRKLDDDKKSRDRRAEVEHEWAKSKVTPADWGEAPAALAAAQGAAVAPPVQPEMVQEGASPGMPATPQGMAALGGADVQQMPKVTVQAEADPLADYKARIKIAEKKGYTDVADEWRGKLTSALSDEIRQQGLLHQQTIAPILQDIERRTAEAKLRNLPLQLSQEEQAIVEKGKDFARKSFGAAIFDMASPSPEIRGAAIQTLGKSLGIEGIADMKVQKIGNDLYFVPVDAKGQAFPDPSKGGKEPLKFHRDDALEQAAQAVGVDKNFIKLGEGETLVQTGRGGVREVARGAPKATNKAETDNVFNQRVAKAATHVDQQFGVDFQTGKLMNSSEAETRMVGEAKVKAEQYVRAGMDPHAAAKKAVDEVKRANAGKGGKPAPSAGAIPEDVDALLR